MVEQAAHLRGVPPASWTAGIVPLPAPAFAVPWLSVRAHLLLESPVPFRRRNIFIDSGYRYPCMTLTAARSSRGDAAAPINTHITGRFAAVYFAARCMGGAMVFGTFQGVFGPPGRGNLLQSRPNAIFIHFVLNGLRVASQMEPSYGVYQ
jgi:hypothetical protein